MRVCFRVSIFVGNIFDSNKTEMLCSDSTCLCYCFCFWKYINAILDVSTNCPNDCIRRTSNRVDFVAVLVGSKRCPPGN